MAKPVVLLGAGASVDAGLPDAYKLTEVVYDDLRKKDPAAARLLGFVIAKLIVRNSRKGHSPFEKINIEEAYDALKRVLNRDGDIIGEFVASWEQLVEFPRNRIDSFSIRDELEGAIGLYQDPHGVARLVFDQDHFRRAIESLLNTTSAQKVDSAKILSNCLDVLAQILNTDEKNIEYLSKFIEEILDNIDCIATLNYDTLLEDAALQHQIEFDYGLTQWNEKRLVRFQPGMSRLLKLHGSVNWVMDGTDEISLSPPTERWKTPPRAMIFGGQYEKLNPNGPFLSLRHEFQRALSKATTLAIVGYSFGDDHLNAMLRSWIAVKRKAKLIVVDPDGINKASRLTGRIAAWNGKRLLSDTVEFHEIRGGFAKSVDVLCEALKRPPMPEGRSSTK